MGEANASLYSATKSGLIGFSKATALELAQFGITVNTINPGWVDTELGNKSVEDSEFSKEEILECIFSTHSTFYGGCFYTTTNHDTPTGCDRNTNI